MTPANAANGGTTANNRATRLGRLGATTSANRFNAARTNMPNAALAANAANPRAAIANSQFAFRSGNFQPGWNPARPYFWHDRRWRCFDGVWAVVDIGWPYDWYSYPYPFMYDGEVYYHGDAYEPGPASGSNLVASVQSDLISQGYDPGPVDGTFGSRTREAIAEFQGDHGMTPTGQIDDPLLQSLGLQQ